MANMVIVSALDVLSMTSNTMLEPFWYGRNLHPHPTLPGALFIARSMS